MKKRGPGRRKFLDGGLFRVLHKVGAWMGAGAGDEKKNTPPRAIDRGGAWNWGGGPPVSAPRSPCNEH